MGSWAAFFIQTNDLSAVIQTLQKLTGIDSVYKGAFPPADLSHWNSRSKRPDFLVIAQTQEDWVMVRHMELEYLHDFAGLLSEELDTRVLAASAQSNVMYYHFSMHDKGTDIRIIRYCYGADVEPINSGTPFAFEEEQPGTRMEYNGEVSWNFDFDDIERYASHFGVVVQPDYSRFPEWTIIKAGGKTVAPDQKANTVTSVPKGDTIKKPWWKIW